MLLVAAAAASIQSQAPAQTDSQAATKVRATALEVQEAILRRYPPELRHRLRLQFRAGDLAPSRRDAPARPLNITDVEVREIQAAALDVLPRAIVNIGTVTTGCKCEDGAGCTDQVWIVATDSRRTKGLQLSRILGRWTIGPVQQWWLRYEEFYAHRDRFADGAEFASAELKLLESMPVCLEQTVRGTERNAQSQNQN